MNEEIQRDLIDKACIIVEYERHNTPIPIDLFKWDSTAERQRMLNETVKKDHYRWGKNESIKIDGNSDKIKASNYRWEQNAYGTTQGVKS